MHRYPYEWTLKDAVFTKDKGTVFSCFACGGGSTMGYKLAGFDVIGCNEIDPKMMSAYIANHKPKYSYLEPIQTFKLRDDLPKELYNLTILDGSPPCSSFSMAGNRDKDWGKDKKFREGQQKQVLDTLFFDFIDLAKKLQPKIVVAENVKGLLMGNAKSYVIEIYKQFEAAGYYVQHFLLDASKMGVPQRRERVFFIALRKDLAKPFLQVVDMFNIQPKLELKFNEKPITYGEIENKDYGYYCKKSEVVYPSWAKRYPNVKPGNCFSDSGKGMFNCNKTDKNSVLPTIVAKFDGGGSFHYEKCRKLNGTELRLAGSFPLDYNFLHQPVQYLIGMSVPPVMTANIVTEIYNQWVSKL
jgi:DNA (cytosine-5)-methyltransferase 1